MNLQRRIALLGSLLFALAPGAWPAGVVELEPLRIEGIEGELRRGSYEVFENREARSGRRIKLNILVLAALGPDKQPDALFVLAGGPGQAATDNAKFFARAFAQVRRERDIVMVDQRGTGGSNGLECDLYGSKAQGHLGDLLPIEAVRRCAEEWKQRADLRLYTTDIAMADVDDVRAALGYGRINLFGTSYGTRAAQIYMRQFPDRVRAVIMKGVTPLSVPLTIPMARDAQRALDLTFDDCLADQACRDAFPNVKDEWQKLLAAVEKGPVETELTGDGGKSERVPFSRATLGPTVRTLLQGVEGAAKLPFLIHRAAAGDFAPFASEALNIRRGFPKVVSEGIFLGLSAIEDVAVTDPQEVVRQSKGTFLRDDYYRQLQRAAELLPNKKMPADYRTPVRSDIPTLLISGFVDPATPPGSADEVARLLKKSRHVVVRYGSHSYGSMSPCIDNIMAEFIKRGAVEGLDTACIEAIKRPPFETSDKN